MGGQRKITQEIIKKQADYLLAVKGNQGKLADAFDNWYSPAMWTGEKYESYSAQGKGHGRQETRLSLVNHNLAALDDLAYDWPEQKINRYYRHDTAGEWWNLWPEKLCVAVLH